MKAGSPIPALTAEQRRAALEKAIAVRVKRRAFKDDVAGGTHGFAAAIALARSDEVLSGIKTLDLLMCLPGVGRRRAEALMAEVGIAPSRRIRGLGQHQTTALVARVTP